MPFEENIDLEDLRSCTESLDEPNHDLVKCSTVHAGLPRYCLPFAALTDNGRVELSSDLQKSVVLFEQSDKVVLIQGVTAQDRAKHRADLLSQHCFSSNLGFRLL